MTTYDALGFDPAPGDLGQVRSLADTLSQAAGAMSEIESVLVGADRGEWRGQAAIAFRELLASDVRPKVSTVTQAFEDARRAVAQWYGDLDRFQSRARGLEMMAEGARRRAEHAAALLSALGPVSPPQSGTPDPDAARQQAETARQREAHAAALSRAQDELEQFRQSARMLHGEYLEAAAAIARLLDTAASAAPEEPNWFESARDALAGMMDDLGAALSDLRDLAIDWLAEWAPLLDLIGDVLSLASTVLGLLAFVPGLQFLAPLAVVLGALALVTHYLAAVGTTGSFTQALTDPGVLLDAVSTVLGLGALRAGMKLTAAARFGGNVKRVPQVVGPPLDVPLGIFAMAGAGRGMGAGEFGWRLTTLKVNQASFAITGVQAPEMAETARKIVMNDFGSLRREKEQCL